MEEKLVSVWPYTVIDYYRNPWFSYLCYTFGLFLVFCIAFLGYWLTTTIRLRILTKRLKRIRFTFRKVQKETGVFSRSVAALVNTAIEEIQELNMFPTEPEQPKYTTHASYLSDSTPPSHSPNSLIPSQYDEVIEAPRGNKKTSDVVNKLVKIKNTNVKNNNDTIASSHDEIPTIVVSPSDYHNRSLSVPYSSQSQPNYSEILASPSSHLPASGDSHECLKSHQSTLIKLIENKVL